MGEYIPQNFQYKCELGGLTIYTSMQDFAAYISPTEARIKSDFITIWENINTEDGISQDEFLKLKSVAACATRYLTANDRYNLIKKLSVGAIWETKEDLILDLFETAGSSSDFDAFMDLIAGDAGLFKHLFGEMDNANIFTKEENKTRFLNTMFALWSSSDFSQHGHSSYTYNESSPYVISYMPEGYPRSYTHSYTFSISDSKLKIDEYLDPEFYSESGHIYYGYHIFQPIRVVFADEDDKVMFPGGDIPAFYLMGVDEVADCKSLMNAFSLQFDVALALTGVGNLTHLKNIPKGYRLAKITIAAVEISSSVADIIMNYTNACNGSDEFCNELREYTFWLQVASLSGDVLFTRMMNKSAKKVLTKIDDSGLDAADNTALRSHLEDVAGSAQNKLGKYSTDFDEYVDVVRREKLYGDDALTFLDAEYRTVKTKKEIVVYRSFGQPKAKLGGAFVASKKGATRAELAILDEWGNSMRFEAKINVPKDVKLNIGKAAPQNGKKIEQTLSGGGDQAIMPFGWDLNWVEEIVDKSTGKVYKSLDKFVEEFGKELVE